MTFELKLLIFALVVLGDLLAMAILAPRLVRQGKSMTAVVLAGTVVISAVFVGVVLFVVV